MEFDPELTKQICWDIQIKFDPKQSEKLPDGFNAEKLFCGEYYLSELYC